MSFPQAAPASSLPGPASVAGGQRPAGWLALPRNEEHLALSWVVAIAASYLAIGIAGMFEPQALFPLLMSGAKGKGAEALPAIETTMAELQAQAEPVEMTVADVAPELNVEVPPVEVMEQPPLDLPELTAALITEDVFVVPAAPRIEEALKPVDPVTPKPVVKTPTPSVRPAASPGTASPTAATPGGGGGNTAVGSGGRGSFPAPPYPSFARSRGMEGTCTLNIRVGPSGAVENVSVSSSTGFSDLDRHAASWVRRNWRWPAGGARSFNLPVSFRLR